MVDPEPALMPGAGGATMLVAVIMDPQEPLLIITE
jgi:hypothetical protein